MARKRSRWGKHALRILSAFLVLLVIVAVVWADVVTGFWQEVVVLSGIAAGLLTFVLTGLLLEPSMARAQHRRWEPLTRVALTDVLHSMADEKASEVSRGKVVARRFTVPEPLRVDDADGLLDAVVEARDDLAESLARWSGFLAASSDVEPLMRRVARISEGLDAIRDEVVEFEAGPGQRQEAAVRGRIERYHEEVDGAVAELTSLLRALHH